MTLRSNSLVVVAGMLLLGLSIEGMGFAQASPDSLRPITVQDLVSVKSPSVVLISPNGKWVAYSVTGPDVTLNRYRKDLVVVPSDSTSPPRVLWSDDASNVKRDTFEPVWTPSSDRLVFFVVKEGRTQVLSATLTGQVETLVDDIGGLNFSAGRALFGQALSFSPNGRFLALLTQSQKTAEVSSEPVLHGIEAGLDYTPPASAHTEAFVHLALLDLRGRSLRFLTDASLTVFEFAWSPKGDRIAFNAAPDVLIGNNMRSDIYVLDVLSGQAQRVVNYPGWDQHPVWSADGTMIAFSSQGETQDWSGAARLAVVDVEGHRPPRLVGDWYTYKIEDITWSADAHSIYLRSTHQMSHQIFRMSLKDGTKERISTRDDASYKDLSCAMNGKVCAFTMEGAARPPDVYVTAIDDFAPRQLTRLNPAWDSLRVPTVQTVSWRSKDDKWDVHGVLLLPSDKPKAVPLPTLTALQGGPGPVIQEFNVIRHYPLLVLGQDYAVFVPNTRGRGGYAKSFQEAISVDQDYVFNPIGDALAGLDWLIERGIADPAKLGVFGFSYGGTLTANAVTVTDRFRAAIYGEGSHDILGNAYNYANAAMLGLTSGWFGYANPFEPEGIQRRYKETVLYRLNRVRTPVLLEAGELDGWKSTRALYRGLQHFGVPSEFYVYPRSGHGWTEPKLIEDGYQRHLAWLDYWIRGKPYPDAVKRERYEAWKQKH